MKRRRVNRPSTTARYDLSSRTGDEYRDTHGLREPAGSVGGFLFGYPSRQAMPKWSQVIAKASFALASSKQKRVPISARSVCQLTLFSLAMRKASPRSKSNCLPAVRTIKQCSFDIRESSPIEPLNNEAAAELHSLRPAHWSKKPGKNDLSEICSQPR